MDFFFVHTALRLRLKTAQNLRCLVRSRRAGGCAMVAKTSGPCSPASRGLKCRGSGGSHIHTCFSGARHCGRPRTEVREPRAARRLAPRGVFPYREFLKQKVSKFRNHLKKCMRASKATPDHALTAKSEAFRACAAWRGIQTVKTSENTSFWQGVPNFDLSKISTPQVFCGSHPPLCFELCECACFELSCASS